MFRIDSHVPRIAALLLTVHAVLLAWLAYRYSPTYDEVGHLPAGVSIWRFGRFDVYRVNPPLVKAVAAIPVLLAGMEEDWSSLGDTTTNRPEWSIGRDFIQVNGPRSFWYWTLARWFCIPLSLVGGYVCYQWTQDLFGGHAALLALCCWTFSPNILAYGALILPDLGATSLGLLAAWSFRNWLKRPTWESALWAGLALGAAELTKMTWVILFAVYPVVWTIYVLTQPVKPVWRQVGIEFRQLAALLGIGLYVLNAGYAFDGSFQRLGDFTFHSQTLTGQEKSGNPGNRFWGTSLEHIPVPLPSDYLNGIDLQKIDFENRKWSFLRGQHRFGGWWYFYLYALAIKEPIGIWVLLGVSLGISVFRAGKVIPWADALCLSIVPLVLLVTVSRETGFSRYVRYALPVLPYAYIVGASSVTCRFVAIRTTAVAACCWMIGSSLYYYPFSFSYCNELVGGPRNGMNYIDCGSLDYGQDALFLRDWIRDHPEARPLHVQATSFFDLNDVGMEFPKVPPCGDGTQIPSGWYAISIDTIQRNSRSSHCFSHLEPVTMIGYSILVYRVP